MAKRVEVVLVDDVDGSEVHRTLRSRSMGAYEIDLSDTNATRLRSALADCVGAARKVAGRGARRSAPSR